MDYNCNNNYYVDENGERHTDIPMGTSPQAAYARTNLRLKNKVEQLENEMADVQEALTQTEGNVSSQLETALNTVTENLEEASDNIQASVTSALSGINARVDNIIAHNNDTEGNTELIDIRTGTDGTVYANAGAAVRSQFQQKIENYNSLQKGIIGTNLTLIASIVGVILYGFSKSEKYYFNVFRKNNNNSGVLQIIIRDSLNNALCNYQSSYQSGIEKITITQSNAGQGVTLENNQTIVVIVDHDQLGSSANLYGMNYETGGISPLSVLEYDHPHIDNELILLKQHINDMQNTIEPIKGTNTTVKSFIKSIRIFTHQLLKFGVVMLKKNINNSGKIFIGIYSFNYNTQERTNDAFAVVSLPMESGIIEYSLTPDSAQITGGQISGNEMIYLRVDYDALPEAVNLAGLSYSECAISEGKINVVHERSFDLLTTPNIRAEDYIKTSGHTPIITYIDDTELSSIGTVKSICDSLGIKCTFACITEKLDNVAGLESTLLLYQKQGFHITTHSKTHGTMWNQNSQEFNTDACETELIESIQRLSKAGFLDSNILVTPYGSYNPVLIKKMKKWAEGMVRVGGSPAGVTANHLYANGRYDIFRTKIDKAYDLSHYQAMIDEAAENGDWLVFYTHSAVASEFDAMLTQNVLQYALSKSVEIMTLNQALKQRMAMYKLYETFK